MPNNETLDLNDPDQYRTLREWARRPWWSKLANIPPVGWETLDRDTKRMLARRDESGDFLG